MWFCLECLCLMLFVIVRRGCVAVLFGFGSVLVVLATARCFFPLEFVWFGVVVLSQFVEMPRLQGRPPVRSIRSLAYAASGLVFTLSPQRLSRSPDVSWLVRPESKSTKGQPWSKLVEAFCFLFAIMETNRCFSAHFKVAQTRNTIVSFVWFACVCVRVRVRVRVCVYMCVCMCRYVYVFVGVFFFKGNLFGKGEQLIVGEPFILGGTSPFFPGIRIFSENHQNPRLETDLVEKNGIGIHP